MFKKNVGQTDRIIRLVVGVALIIGFFAMSGTIAWVSLVLGIVALGTAAMSSCGLYSIFGMSTCSLDTNNQ